MPIAEISALARERGIPCVVVDGAQAVAAIPVNGRRYDAESAGVGPQPLVIGLGAAIERMQGIGMTAVERHGFALRNRAYDQLTMIKKVRVIGPPPGPSATAIVACVLPDDIDSMVLKNDTRLFKRTTVAHHQPQGLKDTA
jgi:selenocysteine lyase/cysteine desulfurase